MKKLSALLLLSATMILASCGKPAESKPVDSEPASETTSQAESKPESAPTSASTPAPSTPASSASTPASSSKPASSSSKPASSSSQAPASSSTPTVTSSVTFSAADFVIENDVAYLKVTGTMSGLTGDAAKFALGLKHKDAADGGLADPLDGQWLVGSATPAAADYKFAPTVAADGSFEVKLSLAGITFVKGAYEMYVGPQGHYAKIDLQQAEYGAGSVKGNGLKLILRGDRDLIFAEELPPVVLTEALTAIEGEGEEAKVFLKVGGELGGATAAEFQAMTVKVTCERQVGGWQKTEMPAESVTNIVDGTKGYIKIDVTSLPVGGYQVKLGFDGTSAPNTVMECESYDLRDNPTVLGGKEYAPYYAAGTNDANHLYGCCGLFIDNAATPIREATTRFEAESLPSSNVTFENKEEGDEATSGTGYAKEMTQSGSSWSRRTSQLDAIVKLPAAGEYTIKVAYKSADATEAGAFNLTIDNNSKGNKGAAAEAWTVFESEAFALEAGKHTISIKGLANVKTDVDYIELVKHDHLGAMTWSEGVAGTAELSAYTPGACTCGKTAIKMAAGADLNGNLTTGGKLGKGTSGSYDGTKISSYKFTAAAAGTVSLYVEGAFDARGNDAASFYHGKVNGSLGKLTDGSTNTVMKMNGAAITLPTETYGELLGTTTENVFKTFKIADVEVQEGANEFTITATNSYGLKWNYFAIIF